MIRKPGEVSFNTPAALPRTGVTSSGLCCCLVGVFVEIESVFYGRDVVGDLQL